MTIYFDTEELKQALEDTYLPADVDVTDPLSFTKIEQIEGNRTAVASYSYGGGWLVRYIGGAGQPGVEYLVKANEKDRSLLACLKKEAFLNHSTKLEQGEDGLVCKAVIANEEGKEKVKGRQTFRMFLEDLESEETEGREFGDLPEVGEAVGEIDGTAFRSMMADAANFGSYTKKDQAEPALVELSPGQMATVSSCSPLHVWFYRWEPAAGSESLRLGFNGAYLPKLKTLPGDRVEIAVNEDYVQFVSESARYIVPRMDEADYLYLVDAWEMLVGDASLTVAAERVFDNTEAKQSVECHQSQDQQLVFAANDTQFEVTKHKDTRKRKDLQLIDFHPDYWQLNSQPWTACILNQSFAMACFKAVQQYLNRYSHLDEISYMVRCQQCYLDLANGERRYFLFLYPEAFGAEGRCRFLFYTPTV